MKWRAHWIWIPGNPIPRNTYVYFRKEMDIGHLPEKAAACICADSRYLLTVNGARVATGPARSDPRHQQYDVLDIRPYLARGRNCLGVTVHHYGESTFSYILGRGGLLFQLYLAEGAGRGRWVISDETWRCCESLCWHKDVPRMTIQIGYPEIYDARREREGWNKAGYDDRNWPCAHKIGKPPIAPWTRLVRREIPLETSREMLPVRVLAVHEIESTAQRFREVKAISRMMANEKFHEIKQVAVTGGEDVARNNASLMKLKSRRNDRGVSLTLDFGKEVFGYPFLEFSANKGTTVDVCYGEVLTADNRVAGAVFGNYADRFISKSGANRHQLFSKRAFRYMQVDITRITGEVQLRKTGVYFSTFPVQYRGKFRCSDETLNRTWTTGAYTVQLNMDDLYTDCPTRERAQWVGDCFLASLTNYYAFGDNRLIRHYLKQIAHSMQQDGMVAALAPSSYNNVIPAYGLFWILTIYNYYLYVGDILLVKELFPDVMRVVNWFLSRETELGLLNLEPPRTAGVYNWISTADTRGYSTALNALYQQVLKVSGKLALLVSDETLSAFYHLRAQRVRNAINQVLWSEKKECYYDNCFNGKHADRFTETTNAMAVVFDVLEKGRQKRLMQRILRAKSMFESPPGTLFSSFTLEALFKCGLHKEALELIEKLWGQEIEKGATTFKEHWYWKGGGLTSQCHGWGSAPTVMLSKYLLGVVPTEGGFRKFLIQPAFSGLPFVEGIVPTPNGDIEVEWQLDDRHIALSFTIPKGLCADLAMDSRIRLMRGYLTKKGKKTARVKTDGDHFVGRNLTCGKYYFESDVVFRDTQKTGGASSP